MHIIGKRKFSYIYRIVKQVDFFQLKRSDNPFKSVLAVLSAIRGLKDILGGIIQHLAECRISASVGALLRLGTLSQTSEGLLKDG